MKKEQESLALEANSSLYLDDGEQQTPYPEQNEEDRDKEKLHFNFLNCTGHVFRHDSCFLLHLLEQGGERRGQGRGRGRKRYVTK